MVKYNVSDVISINDFAFAWRITDDRWDKLQDEVLIHIHPLSNECSTNVCSLSSAFQRSHTNQISGAYQIKQRTSLEDDGATDHERIGQWLNGLPIHHSESVYVCWSSAVAVVVEWNIFIQNWDSLWYPFDRVCVFDETLDWATIFGPEEQAVYIERTPLSQPTRK